MKTRNATLAAFLAASALAFSLPPVTAARAGGDDITFRDDTNSARESDTDTAAAPTAPAGRR
ncbi:MAG: hypothetical protein KKD25_19285 [Gammaproteobacteria bacterium]|jgi:hypothetical protein|nr:hypothetical protein [Gammaproteobacteria bacterium]MBU0773006.1 hypothetical protein [Gammaproteobacteria bacterium]MBU0856504.1 hypothetical protein [Gammaproteobacteria bacterium]MBU1847716.1 hypothetical protein [Gammaproteobacteria bacterium]